MGLKYAMNIDTTKYLVIGAGVSGLSAVNFLLAQNKNVRVMDSREIPPNAKKINDVLPRSQICFGGFDEKWLQQADVIVLSPGVSPHTPEIQEAANCGTEIYGDIELFARYATKPYIAITGSNGKSTVTSLVAEILKSQGIKAKAGANIGEPALDLLNDESIEIYVLELSSFQLETCMSLSPEAAVVLNVSDDHLDRHRSLEEYANIKASIYWNAKHKVVCRSNNSHANLTKETSFGSDQPKGANFGVVEDEGGRWLVHGTERLLSAAEIPLLGVVGELNVLAALALTNTYIKDKVKALKAVREFKGLPHRSELIAEHHGVQWIDDSKGTNVGATVSAVLGLEKPIILILGGVHKGGSVEALREAVQQKVKLVVVFGRDKQVFIDVLQKSTKVIEVNCLDDAVECAYQNIADGDVVLFSPACASFDMFSNYIERGQAYQTAVNRCVFGDSHGG